MPTVLTPQRTHLGRMCRSRLGVRGLCVCTLVRRYDRCGVDTSQQSCLPPQDHVWLCDPPRCALGIRYHNACFVPTSTTILASNIPGGDTFIADADAICSGGCAASCTDCVTYFKATTCPGNALNTPGGPAEIYYPTNCPSFGSGCMISVSPYFCYRLDRSTTYRLQDLPPGAIIAPSCDNGGGNRGNSCCVCVAGCSSGNYQVRDCRTPTAPPTLVPCCCGILQQFTTTASVHYQYFSGTGALVQTIDAAGSYTYNNGVYAGSPCSGVGQADHICGTKVVYGGAGGPVTTNVTYRTPFGSASLCMFGPTSWLFSASDPELKINTCTSLNAPGVAGWDIVSLSQSASCSGNSFSITGRFFDASGRIVITGTHGFSSTYTDEASARCSGGCSTSAPPGFVQLETGIYVPSTILGCTGCSDESSGGLLI